MKISEIIGNDNINKSLNAAMYATLVTLEKEKYITREQRDEIWKQSKH